MDQASARKPSGQAKSDASCNWTEPEVLAIIHWLADPSHLGRYTNGKKAKAHEDISKLPELQNSKTLGQVNNKVNNLLKRYRSAKQMQRSAPASMTDTQKTVHEAKLKRHCGYFYELDRIFGDNPYMNRPLPRDVPGAVGGRGRGGYRSIRSASEIDGLHQVLADGTSAGAVALSTGESDALLGPELIMSAGGGGAGLSGWGEERVTLERERLAFEQGKLDLEQRAHEEDLEMGRERLRVERERLAFDRERYEAERLARIEEREHEQELMRMRLAVAELERGKEASSL